jgi:hypothetical protein
MYLLRSYLHTSNCGFDSRPDLYAYGEALYRLPYPIIPNQIIMNNILHRLIATMPTFFALFVSGEIAALILFCATSVFVAYHALAAEDEPYLGAISDIKTMWVIHLVGIMLVTLYFNL